MTATLTKQNLWNRGFVKDKSEIYNYKLSNKRDHFYAFLVQFMTSAERK